MANDEVGLARLAGAGAGLVQLDIAIDWGRYGELFEYDSESGQLVLGSDPAKAGSDLEAGV